jgi:oxygen-independent coproporphyrinogen-3 oxidase
LLAGPTGERLGIYVHCPYCRAKCPYCDFNVAIHREDRIAPFVAALRAELGRYAGLPWAGRVPAGSLFFGGGTPSLLPPEAVAAVLADARQGLGLAPDAEVTLEANPEGLDTGRLRAFRAAGVTRLSLGVQALDDTLLRRLGRTHSAADARAAYRAARTSGFDDVNLDLLYACPGQDLAAWTRTLDEALAWAPEHLSAYALTLESATPFGRRPPAGVPDEDLQVAQFDALVERTARAGLERYEVSNFARPGRRSRHNLGYWRREDYVGLGPGAHGGLGAVRYATQRSEPRWRTTVLGGGWAIESWERLSERQVAAERIVLGLRLTEGIPVGWLERHLADTPGGGGAALARYEAAGVMAVRAGRLTLTDRGVLVSDAIFAELV